MPAIIVKNYEHYNKAFGNWDTPQGVHVRSKDHYDRLMKENNMITYEEMQRRAVGGKKKEYLLSKEGKGIIEAAKNSMDRRGNVKLSDRTIDAMAKKGIIGKKIPSYMQLPENYAKVKV